MVYTDLLFFLALLPISVLMSFFDRSCEYKNLILVLTSLIFFSWQKPFAVCLMFLSAVIDWLLALWIDKELKKSKDGLIPLFIDGLINSGLLILVTNKFLYINDDVFDFGKIIIPLSIGFYCLKGFSYTYDVYKKNVEAEKNVFCLITYMTAYFLLPVGADFKTANILPQIRKRDLTLEGINKGLTAFVCGLSKAVILAPPLRRIGLAGINSNSVSFMGCWIGITAMILFAYFLFTGFCDISYGLGRIYGFNFNRNYKDIRAKGIFNGFIKNTNIALSDLFSSLNSTSNKILKCFGIFFLCVVGSFWYSRSKVFVFAGIIVGILAILESTILKGFFEKSPRVARIIVTYFSCVLVFALAFSEDLNRALVFFKALFNIGTTGFIDRELKTVFLGNIFIAVISLLFICTPLKNRIKENIDEYASRSIEKYGRISVLKTIATAILLVVCIVLTVSANINL